MATVELTAPPLRPGRRPPWRPAVAGTLGLALALVAGMRMPFAGHGNAGPPPSPPASSAQPADRTVTGLQAYLRGAPDDAPAWARLGLAYVEEARISANPALYPKAEGALGRSTRLQPERNLVALTGRAALANARHDFTAGLGWGEKARAIDPGNPQVQGVVGDSLVELGRYDEAFDAYQRMVDLAPGLASYTRAAYALELQGDVPGARRTLELALGESLTPAELSFAHHSLGELAWNHGDVGDAQLRYEQALRFDPANVASRAGLARVHAARGETSQAIDAWREVTGRAPLPEYVGDFGNLLLAAGRPEEAQDQFALLGAQRRLLRANGVNADLELALFSADHGVDLPAGLQAAQAEWLRRRSVHVADALAWQLHAAGRSGEALTLADEALGLGTGNASFLYHRGMIHQAVGDTVAARADLEAALATNPHFSPLGAARAAEALAALKAR